MTAALAGVGRAALSPFVQATTPVVFVNGVPDASLQIVRLDHATPADHRRAQLLHASTDPAHVDRWRDAELTIAVPHALTDGEARWQVLLSGRTAEHDRDRATGTDRCLITVTDQLAHRLDQPSDTLGPAPVSGDTLGSLLTRLALQLNAGLTPACSASLLAVPIEPDADMLDTLRLRLGAALDRAGLMLRQTIAMSGHAVSRTLQVLPDRAGRRVALPWPDGDGEGVGGGVIKTDAGRRTRPPRQWVALSDRPVIEDTFALAPGWDPSLQGQPDSDYGRLTSTDFSRFGSVYRVWVLNEDGAFTGSPFAAGDAFDAGALFDAPGSITTPLRFLSCLTRDPSGQPVPPVIESSTDSGASWSAYPGVAEVMHDRAGVRLTDDTLPAAILSAAKACTLRLRVTASVQSPDRVEARRWDGNPFAGAGPTRVLRPGDAYRWRRVAPTSIHAGSIDTGTLSTDVADDCAALRAALLDAIDRSSGPRTGATVELAGAWTALRAGDRVDEALAPGIAIDGGATRFGGRPARVRSISLTFGVGDRSPRTVLQLD